MNEEKIRDSKLIAASFPEVGHERKVGGPGSDYHSHMENIGIGVESRNLGKERYCKRPSSPLTFGKL